MVSFSRIRCGLSVRSLTSQSRVKMPGDAAMPSEVLRELIIQLTEPDRLEIIREAEIGDDRPVALTRRHGGRTGGRG